MTRPRAVIVAALSAVAVLAGGCEITNKKLANLPFACETKQCVCTEVEIPIFREAKKVPVEWRPTGDAFCPKGYVLRLAPK